MDLDCHKCKALEVSDGMELDKNDCTHYLHCTNCSTASHITEKDHTADARRCPTCLEKYVQQVESPQNRQPMEGCHHQEATESKTPQTVPPNSQKIPPEQLACQNQFSIFEDLSPAAHIEEDTSNQ